MKRKLDDGEAEFIEERIEREYKDNPPEDLNAVRATMMTLGDGLIRQPSGIPSAGLGLYCERDIAAGTLVTWYSGAIVSSDEYNALKKKDSDYRSHARKFGSRGRVILGNYARDTGTGALRKVPPADLGAVFEHDGALQFMNGGKSGSGAINVAGFRITDRATTVPRDTPLERVVDVADALEREHPLGALFVGVATRDISAGTELITSYGEAYMDQQIKRNPTFRPFGQCRTCPAGAPAQFMCGACSSVSYCSPECYAVETAETGGYCPECGQ